MDNINKYLILKYMHGAYPTANRAYCTDLDSFLPRMAVLMFK